MIITLPAGPEDRDGIPTKMGLDDFIVAYGKEALRALIDQQTSVPQKTNIEDYRKRLVNARMESVGKPNVYLDRSPTGSGKSTADIPAMELAGSSLQIVTTHKQCHETETMLVGAGLDAAAYPKLTQGKGGCDDPDFEPPTCENFKEAELAMQVGLSVSSAVCPRCEFVVDCEYQSQMARADGAAHAIATHKRAELTFEGIAKNKMFIAIHENPSDLLRPVIDVRGGLRNVAHIAHAASENVWHDLDHRYFFGLMEDAAALIEKELSGDSQTQNLPIPTAARVPRNAEILLYDAVKMTGIRPDPDAMRLCKAIAAGYVDELVVRVDTSHGKKGEKRIHRSVCGVWQTKLPEAPVWINDATITTTDAELLAGRQVLDMTPEESLPDIHAAVQVARDVTQRTSPKVVLGILRGILASHPEADHVGVICHRKHAPSIKGTVHKGPRLEPSFQSRIEKVSYYREGQSRGSNEWVDKCDLLICLGTPRIPPSVVKTHLIRLGRIAAACRPDDWIAWGRDYWSGVSESGKRVTVKCLAYRDRDWRKAYQSLVIAELIQAVGRGRQKCENGIPTIVVACDPLGLKLVDSMPQVVSDEAAEVIKAIDELSDINAKGVSGAELSDTSPKVNTLGNMSVSTSDVARRIRKSDRQIRRILNQLRTAGLIVRVGDRGGWMLPTDHHPLNNDRGPAGDRGPSMPKEPTGDQEEKNDEGPL